MYWHRALVFTAAAVLATAASAWAQSSASVEHRVVVGPIVQGGIFGDDSPRPSRRVGLTIGGQARWNPDRRSGLVLDVALQPLATKNPHFDERLRVLTIQMAPEIGRTVYVRPGAGIALHFWSGSSAETGLGFAPTVGLAVGARHKTAKGPRVGAEFLARTSFERGALAWTLGAQVPIGWDSNLR